MFNFYNFFPSRKLDEEFLLSEIYLAPQHPKEKKKKRYIKVMAGVWKKEQLLFLSKVILWYQITNIINNCNYFDEYLRQHHPQIGQRHILGKERNAMILCHGTSLNESSFCLQYPGSMLSFMIFHSFTWSILFIHSSLFIYSFSLYFLPFPSLSFIFRLFVCPVKCKHH